MSDVVSTLFQHQNCPNAREHLSGSLRRNPDIAEQQLRQRPTRRIQPEKQQMFT